MIEPRIKIDDEEWWEMSSSERAEFQEKVTSCMDCSHCISAFSGYKLSEYCTLHKQFISHLVDSHIRNRNTCEDLAEIISGDIDMGKNFTLTVPFSEIRRRS